MLTKLLRATALFVTLRPGAVLTIGAVLAIISSILSANLPLKPSRLDMVPRDDPAVMAWQAVNADFGGVNTLLVVVEGAPDKMRRFADQAAVAIGSIKDKLRSVSHRVDIRHMEAQGFYLLEPARLDKLQRDLIDLVPLMRTMRRDPTPESLVRFIADEIGDPEAPARETTETIDGIRFVGNVVEALQARIDGRVDPMPPVFPSLAVRPKNGKKLRVDDDGYLISASGSRLLMILSPSHELDTVAKTRALLAELDARLVPLAATLGVTFEYTGGPIRSAEEEATVKKDMKLTAAVATVGVFFLCRIAFQGILPGILLTASLWVSIIYCGAFTKLLIGHLNLVGAVFVPLLLALGEDFGNYLLMVYQDSDAPEGPEAMQEAIRTAGPGLVVGALTTAVVFYSLIGHEFVAFREMGIIAGNGIMLAMISMLTLLPASLMLRARWMGLIGKARPVRFEDRIPLSGRLLVAVARPRAISVVICVVLVAMSLRSSRHIDFDFNLTNMLSRSAKTVKFEDILREDFGLQTEVAVVTAGTIEGVHAIKSALETRSTVGSVDSLASLIPLNTAQRRPLVQKISEVSTDFGELTTSIGHSDPVTVSAALESLKTSLDRPRRLANMVESQPLHQEIDRVSARIDALRKGLAETPRPRVDVALQSTALAVRSETDRFADLLKRAGTVVPYTLETLPHELRSRFVSKSGRLATYMSPARDLTAEVDSKAFYDETTALTQDIPKVVKGETVEVAGVPHIIYRMVTLVRAGFENAALLSMVACLFMVSIDFRRLDLGVLALIPVLCGGLWTLGIMGSYGMKWNALDAIVMPLLPGIGVAFGVNIIHRALIEPRIETALASTGRAALYSAYSTVIGFSSLVLADHRGLASFGKVVTLGVICSVVACFALIPTCLVPLLARTSKAPPQPQPPPDSPSNAA